MYSFAGSADEGSVSPSTLHRVSYRDLAMKGLDQLPPFSPVLNSVMASMADEDVPFAQLATTIERDTVLSGNVLRLVNSALYGRRGTVSSVRAAVSILGLNKLRNYLLGLSVSRIWAKARTPGGWAMERFNLHSTAVAVLADLVVQKANVDYPEGAFAAGLLHDLGRLMAAIALPDEHGQIQRAYQSGGKSLEELEQDLLETTHSELSAAALARWGLPVPIQKAVLYHHRSESDPSGTGRRPEALRPLSAAVAAANEIVNHVGHSISVWDQGRGRAPAEVLRDLGLEGHAETIMEAFESELEAVRATL